MDSPALTSAGEHATIDVRVPSQSNLLPRIFGLGDSDTSYEHRLRELLSIVSAGGEVDIEALGLDPKNPADRLLLDQIGPLRETSDAPPPQSGLRGTLEDAILATASGPGQPDLVPVPSKPISEWGHLKVIELLGKGNQGAVYRALETRLNIEVALKLAPLSGSEGDELSHYEEARMLARVRHPNVLIVHGVEVRDGWLGMWTEHIRGANLEEVVRKLGKYGAREAAEIGVMVSDSLAAVHAEGLVHGDIKCENIMREAGGRVVLMDFGLAIQRIEEVDGVEQSTIRGTPAYMAPELFDGKVSSVPSDIYALGVVLYRLVSNRFPVEATNLAALLVAHERGESKNLRDVRPDLPERYLSVVERCLALDESERYSDADELSRDLAAFLEEAPSEDSLSLSFDGGLEPIPTNLPRQLSSFVGRDRNVKDLADLLDGNRLVTVTGAGGCGKTRLALEVATQRLESAPDGVWQVELAPLDDPSLVAETTAAAVGIAEVPSRSAAEVLIEQLSNGRVLLILDNCEHMLDTVADLVRKLLRASAELRILATSREPLGVAGEYLYPLAPFPVPEASESGSVEELLENESVQLFVTRARAVHAEFALTDETAPSVLEICRRLDGIPLAIELAAARTRVLDVDRIRQHLDDRFRLLTSRNRGERSHHDTLRSLIDWSYDRLELNEKAVFRRLSAFRGSWILDAAEAVCAGDGIEEWDVLDLFTRLVDKSMVERVTSSTGSARYRMLETVREYSKDRLGESAEEEVVRRRHRDYFLAVAEEAGAHLYETDQLEWLGRLDAEYDNIRAALEFSSTDADGAPGLRLAGSLAVYWVMRTQWREGRAAAARALAHPDADTHPGPRAGALAAAANISYRLGDFDSAESMYKEVLSISEGLGDETRVARSVLNLGNISYVRGELDAAAAHYRACLEKSRILQDDWGTASALLSLGNVSFSKDELDSAHELYSEAIEIQRKRNDRTAIARSKLLLGIVCHRRGDYETAKSHYEGNLADERELNHVWGVASALVNLAGLELEHGSRERVLEHLREGFELLVELREPTSTTIAIETLASWLLEEDPEFSARLFGASDAFRKSTGMPLSEHDREKYDVGLTLLEDRLGEEAFAAASTSGRAMSIETTLDACIAKAAEYVGSATKDNV